MLGANFTDSTTLVIVFLSIAFFGNGLASITWSLVSALAPTRLIGLTGGMFNFIGNLSSIATPIVIGLMVTDASFAPGFAYMTVITALGIVPYVVLGGPCRTRRRSRRLRLRAAVSRTRVITFRARFGHGRSAP